MAVMAQIRCGFFKSSIVLSLKLVLIAGVVSVLQTPSVLLAAGIPRRWEAKEYKPPTGIGRPGRLDGGGTRAPDSCPVVGKPLMALVPSNGFGVTVAAHPTFFVYMPALSPQSPSLPVEFRLVDMDDNELYKATFHKTSGMSGIVSLNLPTYGGVAPLEVGKDYRWSFSVLCQPDERSRSITVEGLIRRVEPNPTLKTQLMQASLQTQVELYAGAENWYDALAALVQLRRNNPDDAAAAAEWAKLMSAAGLDALTQESLMPISSTPRRQLSSSQP